MMKKINTVLFLLIVLLAFALRFWRLSDIPPSLSHDEVAIGYNAWSILQTGKDEYGEYFPLLFKSFDDYKLPGYIYATAISERIFGLNEFAVRFPSAFLGTLTVVVFYFFVRELFLINSQSETRNPKQYQNPNNKNSKQLEISIIASAILAISPWHVNFSRAAFESNGSLFFILLGIFFLFKAISPVHTTLWSMHQRNSLSRIDTAHDLTIGALCYGVKNQKYFILSSISFVVAIYFYYTARIIIPLLILTFAFVYRRELLKFKKYVLLSIILGFILLAPIIPQMFSSGLSRINQVSIFEDKSLTNPYTQAIVRNNNSIASKIIYNRRVAYMQEFFDNYFKNFAPDFYFTNGTGPMGLMYLWEAPFFIFGLYLVLRSNWRWKWVILVWYFAVPLTGGFTVGQPNALRTLANVPMFALFSATGIYGFYREIYKIKYSKILASFAFAVLLFFFVRFLFLYFDYYPPFVAINWTDGHKQMADLVQANMHKYDYVYITGDYWRPYIYLLFYMNYPPLSYQEKGSRDRIENLYFGKAGWDRGEGIKFATANLPLLVKKKTLFILSSDDLASQNGLIEQEKRPYALKIIKQIDGNIAKGVFYAVVMQ